DTKTAPIFRAHADADLAAKLYRTANCSERPIAWITLKQNVFTSSSQPDLVEFSRPKSIDQDLIAIFRGAMLHQYDSRFATYINGDFEEVECSSKVPDYIARSDKYVSSTYYHTRMKTKNIRNAYHLSIRRIARATDERTMIAAMLPMVGTDDTASIISIDGKLAHECALLGNLNSIVLDYACGFKISGTDIRKHNFLQLPILGPT